MRFLRWLLSGPIRNNGEGYLLSHSQVSKLNSSARLCTVLLVKNILEFKQYTGLGWCPGCWQTSCGIYCRPTIFYNIQQHTPKHQHILPDEDDIVLFFLLCYRDDATIVRIIQYNVQALNTVHEHIALLEVNTLFSMQCCTALVIKIVCSAVRDLLLFQIKYYNICELFFSSKHTGWAMGD